MATYGGNNDQARVTPIAIKRKPRIDPNKTGTLVSKLLKAANQQGVNIDHPESDKYTASASRRSKDRVTVHRPDEVKPTQKPKIVDDGKKEDLYSTGSQFTKPTLPDKALKLMLKGDESDEDFQLGVGRETGSSGKQSTPPRATNLVARLKTTRSVPDVQKALDENMKGKRLSRKFYSDADMTQREMDTNDANNATKPKSLPGKAVKDAVQDKQLDMFSEEEKKAIMEGLLKAVWEINSKGEARETEPGAAARELKTDRDVTRDMKDMGLTPLGNDTTARNYNLKRAHRGNWKPKKGSSRGPGGTKVTEEYKDMLKSSPWKHGHGQPQIEDFGLMKEPYGDWKNPRTAQPQPEDDDKHGYATSSSTGKKYLHGLVTDGKSPELGLTREERKVKAKERKSKKDQGFQFGHHNPETGTFTPRPESKLKGWSVKNRAPAKGNMPDKRQDRNPRHKAQEEAKTATEKIGLTYAAKMMKGLLKAYDESKLNTKQTTLTSGENRRLKDKQKIEGLKATWRAETGNPRTNPSRQGTKETPNRRLNDPYPSSAGKTSPSRPPERKWTPKAYTRNPKLGYNPKAAEGERGSKTGEETFTEGGNVDKVIASGYKKRPLHQGENRNTSTHEGITPTSASVKNMRDKSREVRSKKAATTTARQQEIQRRLPDAKLKGTRRNAGEAIASRQKAERQKGADSRATAKNRDARRAESKANKPSSEDRNKAAKMGLQLMLKARQQRDGKGVDPSGKDPSEKLDIRDNLQVLANLNTDLAKSHSFPLTSGEKTGPVMRGEPSAMYAADGKALEEDPMARKIDIRDKNDSKLEANERTVENRQDSKGRITTVMKSEYTQEDFKSKKTVDDITEEPKVKSRFKPLNSPDSTQKINARVGHAKVNVDEETYEDVEEQTKRRDEKYQAGKPMGQRASRRTDARGYKGNTADVGPSQRHLDVGPTGAPAKPVNRGGKTGTPAVTQESTLTGKRRAELSEADRKKQLAALSPEDRKKTAFQRLKETDKKRIGNAKTKAKMKRDEKQKTQSKEIQLEMDKEIQLEAQSTSPRGFRTHERTRREKRGKKPYRLQRKTEPRFEGNTTGIAWVRTDKYKNKDRETVNPNKGKEIQLEAIKSLLKAKDESGVDDEHDFKQMVGRVRGRIYRNKSTIRGGSKRPETDFNTNSKGDGRDASFSGASDSAHGKSKRGKRGGLTASENSQSEANMAAFISKPQTKKETKDSLKSTYGHTIQNEVEPTICSSLAVFNEILNKTEYDEKRVREQGSAKRSKRRVIANSAADVAAQQTNDTRGI